jgi:hypothetical protein
MDKYREHFRNKTQPRTDYSSGTAQPKIEPFKEAQTALLRSAFAKDEREQFFNLAYCEILSDLFAAWLRTEPHAVKERDFLYASAMALGSVKEKLVAYEKYGPNMEFIQQQQSQEGDENQ